MLSLSRELLGKSIGSYHLSKLIGLGGTGAVFLGSDDDGHEMAVKILIPPILISEESLKEFHKRFQREAEILSQLRHPHILPVTDFGTDADSGFPYMIMPYKSGGTLVEQIQEGPLPFDKAMQYVWQLSQALSYAHKQNIIHRDLKPANVLLDETGQASLADFSIAKLFNLSTTTLTSANQMLGTPAYMAPEQVSNKPISPATDIYGLGVLTYQLLTGCLPFDVSTLLALLQRIIQENPPPAHGIRTDLPPEASDVLLKALAKEPGERFSDAEDFARALEESMQAVLTPSALLQAAQKKLETVQLLEDPAPAVEEVGADENVDEETGEATSSTNDPTIVAYYATSPLEDEQVSAVLVRHTPAAHKSLKLVRLTDENSASRQEAHSSPPSLIDDHATLPENSLPSQQKNEPQENNETTPLIEENNSPSQDGKERAVSHETAPMVTEQQSSIMPEPGEALVTVIAAWQPSHTSSPSLPLNNVAALPTTPLPSEKSVVNQPASLHAAISKRPANLKKLWLRWQVIVAALLLLFLAGEGLFSLYASGHGLFVHQSNGIPTPLPPATSAIINITLNSETLQKTFTITAVTGLPDNKKHQVLARWVYDSTQSHQRTVNATGRVANAATTASGTLLFINSSFTGPVAIPSGTKLTGQGKNANAQVVLDEPVSLPAAPPNSVDPKQRPMQRVRAHYAIGGAAGNIDAQKFSFASGACVPMNPVCYSASNDAPFIGGTDAQDYTFVQQSDIDGASRALQTLAPDPQQQLQGQLSASEQWIVPPSCRPQTASDHAVNDKVPGVTVTVTFACSGEAYDQKGALEAAKQELKERAAKNPGPDYMLNGDINATQPKDPAIDANGGVNVTVDTKGTWIFQLSDTKKQDLMRSIIGKKKLAVQDMLKNIKGIKNATIQLNDGDQNTFPADLQHITINTTSV